MQRVLIVKEKKVPFTITMPANGNCVHKEKKALKTLVPLDTD